MGSGLVCRLTLGVFDGRPSDDCLDVQLAPHRGVATSITFEFAAVSAARHNLRWQRLRESCFEQ